MSNTGMNADSFSLKARRTTRIPLRIPVVLVIDENGKSRSLDGWTMIVNVHGAKIECKRRFGMQEEVVVQVPFNGKSQKGKVVWSRSQPNENGFYEIGVELDRPENLWGVGFPPSDWENARSGKGSAASAAILDLAPKDAIIAPVAEPATPTPMAIPAEAPIGSEPAARQTVTNEMYSSAPEQLSEMLGLTEEESNSGQEQAVEAGDSFVLETVFSSEPPNDSISAQEDSSSMATTTMAADPFEASFSLAQSAVIAAEPNPSSGQEIAQAIRQEKVGNSASFLTGNFTDRLSSIFNELVDSALQTKLLGLIDELGRKVEARAAEVESAVLSRAEQRLKAAALAQSQSLEQHAVEFTAAQQHTLEQNIQRFIESSEEEARGRQEQFLGQSQTTLQAEIDQLVRYGKERLEQQSSDLLLASQKGLRSSMEQELPAIERDLLERCLKQSETLMAGQVEQWTLLHADRIQKSEQTAEQRLNEVSEQVAGRQATALESRLSEIGAQSGARLEQQLGRIGTQVRQAFLRHVVTELGRSQQVCVQQSERQIQKMAADSIERTRLTLSQMMKSLGESLIQQAIPQVAASEAASQDAPPPNETSACHAGDSQTEDLSEMSFGQRHI